MNIFLEVNPLEMTKKTGIATYIDNLCRALFEQRADERFVLYGPEIQKDPYPQYGNKTFRGQTMIPRGLLESLWFELGIGGVPRNVDIYHLLFPARPMPRKNPRTKCVATIYDIAFTYYPETVDGAHRLRYMAKCFPEQVDTADRIVTISKSCKHDLETILGVPPEKITVIYPGVDLEAPTEADNAKLETPWWKELNVPSRYMLCLGTWEPRKNLPTLFRALHRIRKKCEEEDIYLCMSGLKGWKYEEAEAMIRDLGLEERIITLGHVRRDLLPLLYAKSLFFVYPSMYEGFGLPVIEAMACGSPVITSNSSSLPEAGGDAALLVNALDLAELAAAMERLIDEESLRQEMIPKGRAHAARFSYANAAKEHLALYRELLA